MHIARKKMSKFSVIREENGSHIGQPPRHQHFSDRLAASCKSSFKPLIPFPNSLKEAQADYIDLGTTSSASTSPPTTQCLPPSNTFHHYYHHHHHHHSHHHHHHHFISSHLNHPFYLSTSTLALFSFFTFLPHTEAAFLPSSPLIRTSSLHSYYKLHTFQNLTFFSESIQ